MKVIFQALSFCYKNMIFQIHHFNNNYNILRQKQMLAKLKQTAFKQKQYDHLVKIVIIGNSGVGKTNILLRFVQEKYQIVHTPTIGIDFRFKVVTVHRYNGNKKLKLQIWDTAGQQRFKTLTDTYFKAVSGIIVAYAINDRKSFLDIKSWIAQLHEHRVQKVSKIIVANKCDIQDQRKVSSEQGRLLAVQNDCLFMEVSAKQNLNITELFNQLSMNVLNQIQNQLRTKNSQQLSERRLPHIVINESLKSQRKCC